MMGLKERAFAPLVAVSLEELVPQDHFYRHLQKVLDLSFVYNLVRDSYSIAGRPSIDPVVFFKLQLVMFFEDIVRCANRLSRVGNKAFLQARVQACHQLLRAPLATGGYEARSNV